MSDPKLNDYQPVLEDEVVDLRLDSEAALAHAINAWSEVSGVTQGTKATVESILDALHIVMLRIDYAFEQIEELEYLLLEVLPADE